MSSLFSPEARYFIGKSTRIGSQYKKARFVEYESGKFDRVRRLTPDEKHLGVLGPVIRLEVGDTLEVTVLNNASRPFSFYPLGLVLDEKNPQLGE